MARALRLPVFVLAALLAAPSLAPRLAAAQELEQIEESRQLYEEGSALYKTGKYADAEKNFKRVFEIMHTTSVLFDIGLAQEKQRHWGAAADSFDAFMAGSQRVANRKKLQARVVELRKRAARQADLANMANPKVRPQGKPGAPGNEVLESYKDEELQLGSGETAGPEDKDKDTVTPPGAVPPEAPPAEAKPEEKKSRWWIWAVVGGAVLVGAGVGVGVALGTQKPVQPTCPECMGFDQYPFR